MKQVEAVIFDWAGTTVDYGCMAPIHAMQKAFSLYNLDITLAEIRKPMGMLKRDHIQAILNMPRVSSHFEKVHQRAFSTEDVQAINGLFEKNIFAILAAHTTLIDGVLNVQDVLKTQGIKIGSTTGYTQKMMKIVSECARRQGYCPDYIISADEVKEGRPYPYMLHQNILNLNIKNMRAVVKVGDTIIDILEGLHAGCWSIGVIKGSSMLGMSKTEVQTLSGDVLQEKISQVRSEMLAAGANFVIDSLQELPQIIQQIKAQL